MRDEIYDREYQSGRFALNDGIDRLLADLAHGFRRLNARQWSAPWAGARPQPAGPRTPLRHLVLILGGVTLASIASVSLALAPFAMA